LMQDAKTVLLEYGGEEGEIRLDRFLAQRLPECSRSYLRKLIEEGQITVGGAPAKASRALRGGERLAVRLPAAGPAEARPEEIELEVLFEDESIIVVNKAAGMVVHPAPGHAGGTLVSALLAHCKDLAGIGGELRPGIVHRLDAGTSGVMVAAKSDQAHRALAAQFKSRSVGKRYLAAVYGQPDPSEGEIDLAIGRDRRDRKKISASSGSAREARSAYRVLESYGELSLVQVAPQTGRTHQVRVHLAHLGHPIVGDDLYAGARWRGLRSAGLRAAARRMQRPALHAQTLRFQHPGTGAEVEFEAAVPPDLQDLIDRLRSGAGGAK